MYTAPATRKTLRARLLRWYAGHGRDLAWRRTRDPYAILVSEIMLQQTQVSRVGEAYPRFLRLFPTRASLARASLGDVLRAWSGLGYNRRARDLWLAARASPRGLPRTREGLDALPGVGRYTAGAVTCFAFGAPEAFADTNVRRVLGRIVLGRPATEREAEAIDGELLPKTDAARWHHALMDIGATICVARGPRCASCPLASTCAARARGAFGTPVRRQAAFEPSDRRVRGLIINALRTRAHTLAELRHAVADERVGRLVSDLAREGLVERAGSLVRLPG